MLRAPRRRRAAVLPLLLLLVACLTLSCAPGESSSGQTPTTTPRPQASATATTNPYTTPTPPPSHSSVIAQENAQPGSAGWIIPSGELATTEIQAYASATSVVPGDTLTFYVSTPQAGTQYTVEVYRLGWYGGAGGRLLYSTSATGQAQGYYDYTTSALVGCASCLVDASTGLVEARWQPSLKLAIPEDWVTGVYYAKFTEKSGKQTYVQFDVRGAPNTAYLVVTSDNTYEAYNEWGGYSLYLGLNGGRGAKVSFDRPNSGPGLSQGLPYEIDAIRWMEQQSYDVSYMSSVDMNNAGLDLLTHRAIIDLGHDEYWSLQMRNNYDLARDAGLGVAFLGGNDAYWQIRYEADSQGTPDRTIVCYKLPFTDPFYGQNNALLTITWRDPLIGHPENALMGIMYSSWSQSIGFPWRLDADASSALLAGTGLVPGTSYGCDYVGYEWDKVYDNGATPPDLHVLGSSPVTNHDGMSDTSNTAYYVAPSGALVFAAGSIYWSYALDNFRLISGNNCVGQNRAEPGIQRLMANVMEALLTPHPQGW